MASKKKWSLSRRLLVLTNVLSIIAMLGIGFVIIRNTEKEQNAALENKMLMLTKTLASSTGSMIWNLETDNLQKISDNISQDEEINGILFFDDKDKQINKSEFVVGSDKDEKFFSDEIKTHDGKSIGKVSLHYNNHNIEKQKNASIKTILMLILIAQGVISFGMFLVTRQVANSISRIVDRVLHAAEITSNRSLKLKSAAEELSDAVNMEASAIQETVASLDEIKAMGSASLDHATQSTKRANSTHEVTVESKKKIEEMNHMIDGVINNNDLIRARMEQNNTNMGEIIKTINEISAKTAVINDIVFQTKLLSFNASVEAARANEHGKGFAVVAEEVGKLAALSGKAANEISQMIAASISKVEEIANTTKMEVDKIIQQGQGQLNSTQKIAKSCIDSFEEVVLNVSEVKNMMTQVNSAVNEQALGIENIADAMSNLDQLTQKNSVAAQQSSSYSEELANQSVELKHIIDDLQIEVFGETKPVSVSNSENIKASKKSETFEAAEAEDYKHSA